jgi:outer membrane protein
LKRQKELQMLIDQSLEFKKGAQTVLDKAQKEIMQSVKVRLKEVIAKIGKDRKYAFILNTDNNACPFVDGEQGEDITSVALELVRVKK